MDDRIAALEARLQQLEDERDIRQLIASYGPLVDAGEAKAVAALWTDDGVYDVDSGRLSGRGEIASMVRSVAHQGWITGGCAHFLGPAHVTVDGDCATAACHSLMVVRKEGRFIVNRATAHHWTLARTTEGWRVVRRTSRVLDGAEEARLLLSSGVRGETVLSSVDAGSRD